MHATAKRETLVARKKHVSVPDSVPHAGMRPWILCCDSHDKTYLPSHLPAQIPGLSVFTSCSSISGYNVACETHREAPQGGAELDTGRDQCDQH